MKPRVTIMAWGLGGVLALAIGLFASHWLGNRSPTPLNAQLVAFSLPRSDGQIFSSEQLANRVVLINFWATWCAPCRTEIPLLIGAHTLHAPVLAVVGIAVDDIEAVRRFENEMGLDYTSLIAKTEGLALMARYGSPGNLPFTLLFDSKGRLQRQKTGELTANDLDRWLADLL